MGSFYHRLSYSLGNEDWRTEEAALKITKEDRVVSITASGDRPLNLLVHPCKEMIAVDANFSQNALCELKKAALSHLSYDNYFAFLGLKECDDRLAFFHEMKSEMNPKTASFWEKEEKKIERGILFQGKVEKLLLFLSPALQLFAKNAIHELFSFDKIEEQRDFILSRWNHKAWRRTFKLALNPIANRLFQDPGLYLYADYPMTAGDYIYTHLEKALLSFPVKENIIASLLFQGKLFEESYSPHLTEEGVMAIRENSHRLTTVTANAISYLESVEPNSIDCFSLSDIASYMDKKAFDRLSFAMFQAARPNARFCIRELMSMKKFPDKIANHFERDEKLERELEEKDRCFLYRLKIGTIKK